MCEDESLWTLMHSVAHWEFELILILLFDILIAGLLWPFIRKHINHHKCPEDKK